MDNKISQVLIYVLSHYKDNPISLPRLIRLVFLADWYAAIVKNETILSTQWYRRNFGPYSDIILEKLIELNVTIKKGNTESDGMTITVSIHDDQLDYPQLDNDDMSILDLAMKHVYELDFSSLDQYIENLFPIKNTAINAEIEIQKLAQKAP